MTWGTVEMEPEVDDWLDALPAKDFGHVAFYIDLLEAEGTKLHGKLTRPLQGDVHELRFHMGTEDHRISYWIASGRRIILLTHFRKTRMNERREVKRAVRVYKKCVAEGHNAEDE